MTGAGVLTKLAVRRDRIALPVCVYVIVIMLVVNAYEFKKLYPTAASRLALAVSGESNPAFRFLYGRLDGTSIGALTVWRIAVWAGLAAALSTIFLVIRHTRADEEAGRLELVGSGAVGRFAALGASLAVAALVMVLVIVVLFAVLPLLGLPFGGSALLALSVGACGLAFAGVAALTAQLTLSARAARGIALAVLGVAFVLRGSGDAGGLSWLTWTSPLGWVQLARPFGSATGTFSGGARWWVLCLPLAVCVLGVAGAFAVAARRDLGAGLLPERPGRPSASIALQSPDGLAWRLQRGTLFGWLGGYAAVLAISGAAAQGIGQLVGTSSALRTEISRLGGQSGIVDAYLAGLMLLAGVVGGAYATATVLRLRSEETREFAEQVLATAAGRMRWALSHVWVAVAGSALLLAVGGVAAGLGYGLRTGSAGVEVPRMLGAGLSELPAVLVVAGVAVLAFGLVPRWSVAGMWTIVGLLVGLQLFGPLLRFSHWVMDVSPFTHVPHLPGGTVSAWSMVWLCVLAAAFAAAGLFAFRARDIG